MDKLKELKVIVKALGEWPLVTGSLWSEEKWSLERTIQAIRRLFGNLNDEIIDIASSMVIKLNSNYVIILLPQFILIIKSINVYIYFKANTTISKLFIIPKCLS